MSYLWLLTSFIIPKRINKPATIPPNTVFISNHLSYLDAAVLYTAIPGRFKTLGKAEIAKIPIFGILYETVVVTIDRSSSSNRVKSFLNMQTELENGNNVAIFPEGTFDEDKEGLLAFQSGAFKLALLAKATLQPILLLDTRKRVGFKKILNFTPGQCRIKFLPPIPTDNFDDDDDALKAFAHQTMKTALENYSES